VGYGSPQLSPARHRRPVRRRRRGRILAATAVVLLLVAAGLVAAAYVLSGVSVTTGGASLARVRLQPFAGRVTSIHATTPNGAPLPLERRGADVVPRTAVTPGERLTLEVVVRRPRWLRRLFGSERRVERVVTAPVATVVDRFVTVGHGAPRIRFDRPVSSVRLGRRQLTPGSVSVTLPTHAAAGSIVVAAAAEPWERLGRPVRVTWFPKANRPVVVSSPRPGAQVSPLSPLRLTFSAPVSSTVPTANVSGRWSRPDSHTLVFRPGGSGAPFASVETVHLPQTVVVAGAHAASRALSWNVAPASFLRLQQLLAQEGYLPLSWSPAGADVRRAQRDELAAATSPPAGRFRWRYPNTPHELVALWRTGQPNEITRGAVMKFEHDHGLAVDGIAGPQVWHATIEDAVHGKRVGGGYSYVFVHRDVPQLLTLWHDGRVILTSPGNTGVPAAPTQLGTWPVFEHIPVGRMSGTNPDGSHYDDPGIRWISYFHGGEALHAFNRASFGTPQSLGCVELPLAAAAKAWPYTPIGTLVTIEP
jgi:peptidoglycan hydrolase-like protein with peptidoglycan-binding domain